MMLRLVCCKINIWTSVIALTKLMNSMPFCRKSKTRILFLYGQNTKSYYKYEGTDMNKRTKEREVIIIPNGSIYLLVNRKELL